MRIGIDGIVLREKNAGSLRYFEQLLTGLAGAASRHQYVVFVNRKALPPDLICWNDNFALKDVSNIRLLPSALRQQFFLSWNVLGKIDLLHSSVFPPSLWLQCKSVMTVLDLNFDLNPETTKWTGRMWWRLLGWRGIRKADRVITLSEQTRNELVRRGVAKAKTAVIPLFARPIFRPTANQPVIAAKYDLPERYVLYVGTLEPRKNVANLVRAFALASKRRDLAHVLVLAGARGWLYDDIFRTVEELNLRDQVIFLDYVPDEDLPGLYSAADLFVFLSRYEGFGLPVLEAMACGAPVLASNSSALPEVVGDAGIMVPPDDVEQAAIEMTRLLTDRELRAAMVERGLRRARLFSPERFIRQTLQAYDEAICASA
jgi:glycosyltransferase involved in cell wall biosynthesis